MFDFELPPGWLPHPDAPGYFYKGDRVKSEAQMRVKAANRAAHLAGQATKNIGKKPTDKINSSQHPAAGDKANPQLLALMQAAQHAAAEALPVVLEAAVKEHLAPSDAPTHSALDNLQTQCFTPEYRLRQLAVSQVPMALAQLSVIAADPLQLGPTRVSAAAHIIERAVGKPTVRLTPILDDLAAMPAVDAYACLSRIAKQGELSAEDVKAYSALIDGRAKGQEGRDLLERLAAVEALLDGSRTVN
jgi:hypothetical protein